MRQRLAAVLAADIVDYTRLMGADQAGTLSALRAFRTETLRPKVMGHHGQLIKDMGDGWLAEFASASEAVSCALDMQAALSRHSTLRLRIGINIGDVLHEGEDIFGDGVNVAARLQAVAPAGGIALSGAVHAVLDGTLAPGFSDAGLHEFKNVSRPVHVWMSAPSAEYPSEGHGALLPAHKLTRLAIRPMAPDTQDMSVRDLAAAITRDVLQLLHSSDWIAPRVTTSDEANDYVLTSALRVRGDQLRLEVQLSDLLGERVWAGAFDGAVTGSFEWQDQVGRQVASNVFGAITDRERTRLLEKPLSELTAEECLACAMLEFFEISDASLASSLAYVDHAIGRDPDLASAYLHGVRCLLAAIAVGYRNGVRDWLEQLPHWLDLAEQSPTALIRTHLYRGLWAHTVKRDPKALRDCVDMALAQAPNDLDVVCLGGWAYVWLGEVEAAIACFRKFQNRGQFSLMSMAVQAGLSTALVQAGREAEAAKTASGIVRHTREFAVPFRVLAAANAHLGETARAREAVADALRLVPGDTLAALKERSGFCDADANNHFFEGLRRAGFPEG